MAARAGTLLHRCAAPPQPCRGAHHRRPRACCAAAARALHNECFTALPRRGRGFLPLEDPPTRLGAPSRFSSKVASSHHDAWEEALSALPQLMAGSPVALRAALLSLPPLGAAALVAAGDERQMWRAQLVVSFLAHAFVWCGPPDAPPPAALPAVLAAPWVALSTALDVPPVLTYASYNLLNWRRFDATAPIRLGNIVSLHGFTASPDEDQFRVIHIAIEARAGAALVALEHARRCAHAGGADGADAADAAALAALEELAAALQAMQAILARLPERCDPGVYYHTVRRPLGGWRSSAALPAGLFYEGVGDAAPRAYYGASGAQSSVLPAFDAALGVRHGGATLRPYLEAVRWHAPRQARAWLDGGDAPRSSCAEVLRAAALRARSVTLRHAYNDAVEELSRFRAMHREFAAAYISAHGGAAAGGKGTGGTDYVSALAGYHHATEGAKLLLP